MNVDVIVVLKHSMIISRRHNNINVVFVLVVDVIAAAAAVKHSCII